MHKVRIIIGFNKATIVADGFSDPMEEDHFIEKAQLISEGHLVSEKILGPGNSPRINFTISNLSVKQLQVLKARIFCNQHGIFES